MRWYPTHKEVVKIKEIISGLPLAQDLTYTESNHAQLQGHIHTNRKPSGKRKRHWLCLLTLHWPLWHQHPKGPLGMVHSQRRWTSHPWLAAEHVTWAANQSFLSQGYRGWFRDRHTTQTQPVGFILGFVLKL